MQRQALANRVFSNCCGWQDDGCFEMAVNTRRRKADGTPGNRHHNPLAAFVVCNHQVDTVVEICLGILGHRQIVLRIENRFEQCLANSAGFGLIHPAVDRHVPFIAGRVQPCAGTEKHDDLIDLQFGLSISLQ